jgi:hypothetical protein
MKIIEGHVRLAASDVANFLACQRLTQLDLLRARGELRPPREFDIGFQDLVRRGEAHERGVLEQFRADGLGVIDVSGTVDAAGATADAIRDGAGVVYQGTLAGGRPGTALFGRPDFLVRADLLPAPDGEPRPGWVHYEVVDAKLARSARARAVLRTAASSGCSTCSASSTWPRSTSRVASAAAVREGGQAQYIERVGLEPTTGGL